MKVLSPSVLLIVALSSAPALASQSYNFSYTPDATDTITGSFIGTATGDIITNLTDISIFYNNVAFIGNGSLKPWSLVFDTFYVPDGGYVSGNATHLAQISFSGNSNNFLFTDDHTIYQNSANEFLSTPLYAGKTYLTIGQNFNVFLPRPDTTNWSVTAVPLPCAIWLFASALGLLSFTNRKNKTASSLNMT
ncbi:MAG: hypothetical protein WCP01_15860 [Methylococcaceae bacterium]